MATKIGNNAALISTWRCLHMREGFKNLFSEKIFKSLCAKPLRLSKKPAAGFEVCITVHNSYCPEVYVFGVRVFSTHI